MPYSPRIDKCEQSGYIVLTLSHFLLFVYFQWSRQNKVKLNDQWKEVPGAINIILSVRKFWITRILNLV